MDAISVSSSRKHHRPSATLIPVILRILDDSGRHRITEPIVGILTDVSSRELCVTVTGPTGRPLSRNLGRKRKVQLSFINNELHTMIESLVCELIETKGTDPKADSRIVRLSVPQLPSDLFEEILIALKRYVPPQRNTSRQPLLIGLLLLGIGLGFVAWTSIQLSRPSIQNARSNVRMKRQVAVLTESLKYSTKTVEELASDLEIADEEIASLKNKLESSKKKKKKKKPKTTSLAPSSKVSPSPKSNDTGPNAPKSVRLRNTTWGDFQKLKAIRGTEPNPNLEFSHGVIELTEHSQVYRRTRQMLTRLLSAYTVAKGIDLRSLGTLSLSSSDYKVSIEPDEGFALGPDEKKTPDIAFDHSTVIERPVLLKKFRDIGVPEVWLKLDAGLEIYALSSQGYERRESSPTLPNLDITLLMVYLERPDQTAATREFINALSSN